MVLSLYHSNPTTVSSPLVLRSESLQWPLKPSHDLVPDSLSCFILYSSPFGHSVPAITGPSAWNNGPQACHVTYSLSCHISTQMSVRLILTTLYQMQSIHSSKQIRFVHLLDSWYCSVPWEYNSQQNRYKISCAHGAYKLLGTRKEREIINNQVYTVCQMR